MPIQRDVKDVNACARGENLQCERFACSRQKDVNDKTPTILKSH